MTPLGAIPWALLLEYDGTSFAGWQHQANACTVQSVLEDACARLNGGAPVSSFVAGRTDAGVHAAGQVALVSLPDRYRAGQVRDALNFHLLPHPVAVLRAAPAAPGWNPRFDAVGRAYAYRILNRRARPALDRHRAWHVERPLDADAMTEAASLLLGRHDFSSFRASACQAKSPLRTLDRLDADAMAAAAALLLGRHDFTSFRASACQAKSPLRTLDRLDVTRHGEVLTVAAEARSFLHHQVRNMVGTLKLVGEGRWRPAQVRAALDARDRRAAGPTAPPDGLTLVGVRYGRDPFGAGGVAQ